MSGSYQERQRAAADQMVRAAAKAVAAAETQLRVAREELDDAVAQATNEASIPVSAVAETAGVSRQTVYAAARRAHERRRPRLPFD